MILAGIDEAGLGPNLGPLVTACAAFRVPDGWTPETPWDALGAACRREWRKAEARPCVADSKIVYAKGGIAALEKTLAAFARNLGGEGRPAFSVSEAFPDSRAGGAVPAGAAPHAPHPCYCLDRLRAELFPPGGAAEEGEGAAPALGDALAACGASVVRLEAGRLFEPAMNARFAAGLNKNEILLMETGARLAGLAEAFPAEPVLAVVDKQGGRNDYLPFLSRLFAGDWVEALSAGTERSAYRVRRAGPDGGVLEIRFAAKGDRDSFATALASMLAKYARERAMAALNAWFGARVPGVRATAGYPLDAKRWRREMESPGNARALWLEKVWRVK